MNTPRARQMSVRTKLLGLVALLLAMSAGIVAFSFASLQSIGDRMSDAQSANSNLSSAAALDHAILDARRLLDKGVARIGVASDQSAIDKSLSADNSTISSTIADLRSQDLAASEQSTLDDLQKQLDAWGPVRDQIRAASLAGDASLAITLQNSVQTAAGQASADAVAFEQIQVGQTADAMNGAGSADGTARGALIAILVISLLAGTALALYLARSIMLGLRAVQSAVTTVADRCATDLAIGLEAFARNDLTVEVKTDTEPIGRYGNDEIGATARAADRLLERIRATIDSYEIARAGLAETVGEVKAAADSVARTSEDLSLAATQSGTASSQIAQTINQVASGASEQARSSSDTSAAVVELDEIISRVSVAAANIEARIGASSAAVGEMAAGIDKTSSASTEVSAVAAEARAASEQGRMAVRQTIDEMERIKATVRLASKRVSDLGAKSDEIGAIVETIDDIAEQTNLLALNAAIEAARAGEQGKGFAVVADEVRKLAERASRATKEIGTLIGEVQLGTGEAVAAMQAGAEEVEAGGTLAAQAGASLDSIARSVGATTEAAERISDAVASMGKSCAKVVAASDTIARVAAETNEATRRMSATASTVSSAVQSIAAISEENSASAEEVSAATEEMSAQAEEVVASAASLAQMAKDLDAVVAKFVLESTRTDRAPMPIRRARAA